ncbi:MAG: hypothetical protein PHX83_17060 [Acidobacteriia bacterium]|nr:hypothetical protein [Terriglobia bacterium]
MSASFRRIDYSLRPAKHAERRMLCDLFRRLRPFGRIEEYVYVGFGSVWFSDFVLFHRALGIKKMISIEQTVSARDRIEENKPFRIPVDYRRSGEALQALDWNSKHFLWLDYDDPLTNEMLQDVGTVARRAQSGSVLVVSVQCMKSPQISQAEQDNTATAMERFVSEFGRDRVAQSTTEDQLYGWQFGALSRQMVIREIEAILAIRNSSNEGVGTIDFHPICELEYEDGAKMTTVVGVFCAADDYDTLRSCHFESLDFLSNPPGPVRIAVPKLTVREFRKLESQLPLAAGSNLELGTIPQAEANRFVEMYRYLPNFAVLEA